jgi:hypothetical protein
MLQGALRGLVFAFDPVDGLTELVTAFVDCVLHIRGGSLELCLIGRAQVRGRLLCSGEEVSKIGKPVLDTFCDLVPVLHLRDARLLNLTQHCVCVLHDGPEEVHERVFRFREVRCRARSRLPRCVGVADVRPPLSEGGADVTRPLLRRHALRWCGHSAGRRLLTARPCSTGWQQQSARHDQPDKTRPELQDPALSVTRKRIRGEVINQAEIKPKARAVGARVKK